MSEELYDITVAAGRRVLASTQNLVISPGTVTFLFGESGIGKSLLAKALFGILDDPDLRVRVNGESYRRYCSRPEVVGRKTHGFFMFQEPSSHLNPLQSLDDQLHEGALAQAGDPIGPVRELWDAHGDAELERLLPVFPKPYRPSGGEKQRVLAAMAFSKMDVAPERTDEGGELFVFDEPTGSLDREARDRFLDRLFDRFRKRKQTILLITHDYGMIGYVQAHHRALLGQIRFRELVLESGRAKVREFASERFMRWLGDQRPQRAEYRKTPLLRVESGIQVFGRTLRFLEGASGKGEVDMSIHPGELVYLKAGSGIGKTTVAKIVIGLQNADHFRMEFEGVRLGEVSPRHYWRKNLWGKKMTMAFQHADESLNPNASVEDTLRLLSLPHLRTSEGVTQALEKVFDPEEVVQLRRKKIWQLSGGQKQRLNILRAFTLSTPLIILDEPLNALDFESIDRVLALVRDARSNEQSILLISHNEDIFDAIVPPESVHRLESITTS
ncbi:MAG TPA: ATP-binding cassette domain-containing protein [Bacteroidota bacterium]|nr:ATP-binding cassette domain-containing protein [Bacteroidota bacterium]